MRSWFFFLCLTAIWVPSLRAADPPSFQYVGSGSCSAYGCHGNTVSRDVDVWKSSFVLWSRNDPHARASRVLFQKRSAKMVELLMAGEGNREREATELALSAANGAKVNSSERNLSAAEYEAEYVRIVEQRCIGCHATPAATEPLATAPTSRKASDFLTQGVSCESCHGPASAYQAEHATKRWEKYSSAEKLERWGLTNTHELATRAAVCVECHVGPRESETGKRFDVTHDLIAAGHPRLNFEFSAYLANLPPHWNESKDKSRAGHSNDGNFYFAAWRIGQFQSARKLVEQLQAHSSPADDRSMTSPWPEFANFDCFDCHHRLSADRLMRAGRTTIASSRRGHPQPADWPLAQLHTMVQTTANPSIRELNQAIADARTNYVFDLNSAVGGQQNSFARLAAKLTESAEEFSKESFSTETTVPVLENLLNETTVGQAACWDRIVQFQLALAAFLEDRDSKDSKYSNLRFHSQSLAKYLDRRFANEPLSIYSSPQQFDPAAEELRTHLQEISVDLKSLR